MSAERRQAALGRSLRYWALACLVFVSTENAAAQIGPATGEKSQARGSLRSRLGVDAAAPLLRSEATELRLRGFEKLGATGTSAALELLADALESGGAARTANERLTAVRALAPHAREERSRGALVRAMGGALTRDEPSEIMVRQTAALALARSGDKNALQALAQALRQPGRTSETARIALRAHPPRAFEPLLLARGVPTPALAGLVGDLGFARGRDLLITLSQSGAPALRAEALIALAKVDRATAVRLARSTYKNEKHRVLRTAAARVLAIARDGEAPAALGALLAEPSLVGDALSIALDAPSSAFGPVLARVTPGDPGDGERLLAALGRAGGRAAFERLERTLGQPDLGWAAAYALALSPDDSAEDVLERALERPAMRRDAARAAVLRLRSSGSELSGLDSALAILEASNAPADRAAAAFCRAVVDANAGVKLVGSRDATIARAAAHAALDPVVSLAAARRLAIEPDPLMRSSLALSLARPEAADLVPTSVLTGLFETRGAAAHLAAHALAARDSDLERPRLRELLSSGDPLLRAHVALGLARSKESSAVGLLHDAYRFESEPVVRRAIVDALAKRSEPGRERTLRLAADLDPDDKARSEARRAIAHRPNRAAADAPNGTAWIRLDGPPSTSTIAVVVTAAGLALPIGPDPDGHVALVGLPGGSVGVTLASAAPGGDSSKPGTK